MPQILPGETPVKLGATKLLFHRVNPGTVILPYGAGTAGVAFHPDEIKRIS